MENEQTAPESLPEPAPDVEPAKLARFAARWQQFRGWYGTHKKIAIPATILVILLLIAAVPWTRYKTVGLVYKKDFTMQIKDSTGGAPVSGATVSVGEVRGTTDGNGRVVLRKLSVGPHQALVSKRYYKDAKINILVPILGQKEVPSLAAASIGRQVKVVVTDKINQKPLSEVNIKTADITAKTDKKGEATVVLKAGTTEAELTLSRGGYNQDTVKVEASGSEIRENNFKLTPSGKVYFLSKLSGRIDVVKTNLDGTNRKVVLAGTGNEDDDDTQLMASKDWKYLAFKSDRSGAGPVLYLINTTNDELTTIDQARANFTLIGWDGANLAYKLFRQDINNWTSGQEALKSYNATSGNLVLLNQSKASGTSGSDYAKESYNDHYIASGSIVFTKIWGFGSKSTQQDPNQAQAALYTITLNGQNFRTLATFNYKVISTPEEDGFLATNYYYFTSYPSKPNQIMLRLHNSENAQASYFKYANGQLTEDAALAATFDKEFNAANSYLFSPGGKQTFWAELRDGKSTMFIADASGNSPKQIASLSDYEPYGWFSDNYLLVSKKSSELYIMPVEGIKQDSDALKITDYHRAI